MAYAAPGMLASGGVTPSCPVPSPGTHGPAAVRSDQNWGFMLLAFVPGGVSSDIQLSLEDKKGTPGHLKGTFSTLSEGKVWALFLSQKSSLFLVHGTCQSSKD